MQVLRLPLLLLLLMLLLLLPRGLKENIRDKKGEKKIREWKRKLVKILSCKLGAGN